MNPAPVPFESLWTANEVKAYLNCSRTTVYTWAEAGTLPSLRIGGLLRFDPAAVRRWALGDSPGRPATVTPIRSAKVTP